MKETAIQINNRKIRNSLRKQAEVIQREKEKVWDRLKETTPGSTYVDAFDNTMTHSMKLEQEITDAIFLEFARELKWQNQKYK